jgi:hypothetical protein
MNSSVILGLSVESYDAYLKYFRLTAEVIASAALSILEGRS